jgi:hypothetical protein
MIEVKVFPKKGALKMQIRTPKSVCHFVSIEQQNSNLVNS